MTSENPSPAADSAAETRWLAIETSGRYGSVAVGVGEAADETSPQVASRLDLPRDRRSAQTLCPTIEELLAEVAWRPESIDAIAVAIGPGSFTGLRVGVATAKAMAYALGAKIVGVNTLDAMAEPLAETSTGRLWTLLDAQRGELFASVRSGVAAPGATPTERLTREELASRLTEGDHLVGPIVESLVLAGSLPKSLNLTHETTEPNAAGVLRVARRRWLAGASDEVFQLVPAYYRVSAAEENRRGG